MAVNDALYTSARDTWETPPAFFAAIQARYRLDWDVCAEPHTAKLPNFWTKAEDALAQDWAGKRCWLNPPYGRQIGKWTAKARSSAEGDSGVGTVVVALLPARTDTAWWHDHVLCATKIYLVRGRLRFVGAPSSAPFPSAVVVGDHWSRGPGLPDLGTVNSTGEAL